MTNNLYLSLNPLASSSSTVRGSVQPGVKEVLGLSGEGTHAHTGSMVQATRPTHIRTDLESHSRTDFQLEPDRPPLPALLSNL